MKRFSSVDRPPPPADTPAGPVDDVSASPEGVASFRGGALSLFQWFERRFREMALERGAEELRFPHLIRRETLDQAGYFEAFPHGATAVRAEHASDTHLLQPAVCYHCYQALEGRTLEAPIVWTCQGNCFRHENGKFASLARLWEFTMREIVFVGPPAWVREQRETWMTAIRNLSQFLNLAGEMEPAVDPFYGGASRGRKILQQLKELKFEWNVEVPASGTRVAAASFNLHESFFTDRFHIGFKGGGPCASGCVAFGLERWVLAHSSQRGPGLPVATSSIQSRS